MSPNLHSFFVHFPVAISFILPLMVIWAIIQFKKDQASANKIWFMVTIPMVIMAAFTIFAVIAGEAAHEILEKYMDEKPIEKHAEIAEVFAMLVYITAGLSLFIFIFQGKRKQLFMFSILGLTIIMLPLAMISGKTGGEIVHKFDSPQFMKKAIDKGALENSGRHEHYENEANQDEEIEEK